QLCFGQLVKVRTPMAISDQEYEEARDTIPRLLKLADERIKALLTPEDVVSLTTSRPTAIAWLSRDRRSRQVGYYFLRSHHCLPFDVIPILMTIATGDDPDDSRTAAIKELWHYFSMHGCDSELRRIACLVIDDSQPQVVRMEAYNT